MDTPTPTPNSNRTEKPSRPRRRTIAIAIVGAASIAGAVAVAGLGLPSLAGASDSEPTERRAAMVEVTENEQRLENVTLGALADELAELGLELTVSPAGDYDLDPLDADEGVGTDSDDPFAGMTDQEVEALSDEEFLAILEEAGWSVGDDSFEPGDGNGSFDNEPTNEEDYDEDASDGTVATFAVDGDSLTPTGGDRTAVAEGEAIWKRFVELIPAEQRSMIIGFEVLSEDGGVGGWVYPDNNDPTKWNIGISLGLGAGEDSVLIHEFGHLLTLQAKEVPPNSDDDGSCPTYHTGEGCSLSGSTMAEFVARFWPQSQLDEVMVAQESDGWDAIEEFYENHKDDFVTDYATTSPAEDLAETFTTFVLKERPSGDTIADQKVQLLWSDPGMVDLRDQIRAAL